MPARPLVFYPDRRLWLKAQPVTAWDDELQALAGDVLDTMSAVAAAGLIKRWAKLRRADAIVR